MTSISPFSLPMAARHLGLLHYNVRSALWVLKLHNRIQEIVLVPAVYARGNKYP